MFWDSLKAPFSILAPMEGVTDIVFRQVVAKAGRPSVFFTEFTNVCSYASEAGRPNATQRLEFLPEEQPIVAQIWGKTPADFALTANGLKELGYQAVDINTGCPDKNVIRQGCGAALIKDPKLTAEIIQATKSSGLETSVKCRLGYSKLEEYKTWIPHLLSQDIKALTVHLRTKKEMSKVPAHFELIPELVRMRNDIAPQTKLIINGDIPDVATGYQLIAQHNPAGKSSAGLDGIMIGRGVFQNPFCFTDHQPTQADLLDLLHYHLNLWEAHANTHGEHCGVNRPVGKVGCQRPVVLRDMGDLREPSFEPLKRFFKIYIHGVRGASDLRAKLMETKNITQVRAILKEEGL